MNRKLTKKRFHRKTEKTEKHDSRKLCQEHRKKLDFICRNHDLLFCELCSNLYHSDCQTVNISSLKKSMKYDLLELRRNANQLVSHYETAGKAFQDSQDNVLSEIEDAEAEIRKMFEELKSRVHNLGAKNSEKISKRRKAVKEIQQDAQDALYSLERVGDEKGELETSEKTNKSLEIKLAEQRDNKFTLHMTAEFSEDLKAIVEKVNDPFAIGTVKVKQNASPDSNKIKLDSSRHLDLTKRDKMNFTPQFTSLEFLPDGRLVTLDSYNKRATIVGQQLDTLSQYKFKYSPLDLAVIAEDDFAVTSGVEYFIDIMNVNKKNCITLTKRLPTSACYDSICLMYGDTMFATLFADKRQVRLVTSDGRESDIIDIPEKKESQMGSLSVAYIRDSGVLVVADRYQHIVRMYDANGNFADIGTISDVSIREPRGLCVAPNGSVFVCSQGNHAVVQLSPSRKVVKVHRTEMRYPRAVCVDRNGDKLAVANGIKEAGKLQVYDLKE